MFEWNFQPTNTPQNYIPSHNIHKQTPSSLHRDINTVHFSQRPLHSLMDSSQSVDAATHVTDKVLYRRLVEIGVDAEESMRIMAFWMWVEAQGFIELVPKISANNDQLLAMVADETKAILAAFDPSSTTPITQNLCPITSLILYPVSVEEIFGDKDVVSEGVSEVHNQVCGVLFKDVFEEGDKSGKTEGSVTEVGEGSGKDGNESSGKTLNPFAKEWDPAVERAPEEDRCLFLTFSNGYPLSDNQIVEFFNQ